MSHQNDATDSYGCPAATDFRIPGSDLILLTRCSRRAGHDGKHNNPRTKSWRNSGTTWLLAPPAYAMTEACTRPIPPASGGAS